MSRSTMLLKCIPHILLCSIIIIKSVTGERISKSSLTFVIDDTQSMHDDIEQVKIGVEAIFDTVLSHSESQIENFILVTFNDYTFEQPDVNTDLSDTKLRIVTKKRDEFKNALNSIDVYKDWGGDCPEYSMSGIKRGLEVSLPGSIIYVFTDASSKDHILYESVRSLAIKKQCQVVFVLTGKCIPYEGSYEVYPNLAYATSGAVFHLEKQEIGVILKYIEKIIIQRRTTLVSKPSLPGGENVVIVPTDAKIVDGIVAVSSKGEITSLQVFGPDGTKLPVTTIAKTDMIWIDNFKAIHPGNYTVHIESEEAISVLVTGTSEVLIQHGFSTIKPTSIEGTTTRPVPGIKSHISIELTKGDIPLVTIQIRDMKEKLIPFIANDDNPVMETPLIRINEKFYMTEPILPPNSTFQIVVIGYDPKSKTNIIRLSPPIEVQKVIAEEVKVVLPSVKIEGDSTVNATYDDTLKLTCRVSAYPRPDMMWRNVNNGELLPSEVSIYELPNDYTSILILDSVKENATYECSAINKDGLDTGRVTVMTEPKHYFNVMGPLLNRSYVEYQKDGEIICKVDAYPPAKLTWLRNGRPLLSSENVQIIGTLNNSTLKIKRAKLSDKGKYICIAKNEDKHERIVNMVEIVGLEPPKIGRDIDEIHVNESSSAEIVCNLIQGKPKPSIQWFYKSIKSSAKFDSKPEWNGYTTIYLENLRKNDAGTYQCQAQNDIGSDYHDTDLVVQYPPKIEKGKEFMKLKVGDKLSIKCDINGIPTPKVFWFKDNSPLSYRSVTHNDHFIKPDVQLSDSGNYTCHAINKIGSDARTVRVKVILPVHITPPNNTNINVIVGNTITLPCQATGYPEPNIEWIYRSSSDDQNVTYRISTKESLNLNHIQLKQEGQYICIATNTEGSTKITYDVHVFAPPIIVNHYLSKRLTAVEGDVALRITCKASGHPKPVITWSKDGLNLALGTYYSIDGDNLIIKDVAKASEGIYKCEARNHFGIDSEIYEVAVNSYVSPKYPTSTVRIKSGTSAVIPCNVNHTLVDQLRWFKNGAHIRNGELLLDNARYSDAGVYTCRVSNIFSSISDDVEVIVGHAPVFQFDEDLTVEVDDGSPYELHCDATGVPEPIITWFFDDELLDTTGPVYSVEMNVGSVGDYTCVVKNDFGKITRTFNVVTSDCLLNTDKSPKQPQLLSTNLDWPHFDTVNKQIVIPQNERFILYCPSRFKMFSKSNYLQAICDKDKKIMVNGAKYEYKDLQCNEKIEYQVRKTREKCLHADTEKIKIEYQYNHSIYYPLTKPATEVYEICFDKINNVPIYARHIMQTSLAMDDIEENWSYDYDFLINFDDAYNCKRQTNKISASLGIDFHRDGECCFSRRQLVNPRDVFTGVPQRATYSYFNVIPHWSTCHMENWDELERRVRLLGKAAYYSDIFVWTGTADQLSLPNGLGHRQKIYISDRIGDSQPVPLYLWKVVQDPRTRSSLAIVQLNIPDLSPSDASKYVICKDICHKIDWMSGTQWRDVNRGYTFCCSLEDFENNFGYRKMFEENMANVLQIKDYEMASVHS